MSAVRSASAASLFIHRDMPDSPPSVPVTLDLKMRERVWNSRVERTHSVVVHHTATLLSHRWIVSHPRLLWVAPLGRVQFPGAHLVEVIWVAVKARPRAHRPPLWAELTASLNSVHQVSPASYAFTLRRLDVSPAVRRWVVRLSGRCWVGSGPSVILIWLLMVDAVLAGAGRVGVLKKSVVSCCLGAFCVHILTRLETRVENALENKWSPPLQARSSPVIHSLFSSSASSHKKTFLWPLWYVLLKTSPSPSFLSVVPLFLLCCSC